MGFSHAHWIQGVIERLLVQDFLLDAQFTDRLATGKGFFGEFGGFFVTDVGVKAGHHRK